MAWGNVTSSLKGKLFNFIKIYDHRATKENKVRKKYKYAVKTCVSEKMNSLL